MDSRCLVRPVVVQDEMRVDVQRQLRINAIQELTKRDRAVSPMRFATYPASRDVERGNNDVLPWCV
jgi:hypothetical protein